MRHALHPCSLSKTGGRTVHPGVNHGPHPHVGNGLRLRQKANLSERPSWRQLCGECWTCQQALLALVFVRDVHMLSAKAFTSYSKG